MARLVRIQRVMHHYGLTEFVRGTAVESRLKWIAAASPWLWLQGRAHGTRGERLRLALQELGPVFVKFGQAISTRRDLLPPDIADELVKLQDQEIGRAHV